MCSKASVKARCSILHIVNSLPCLAAEATVSAQGFKCVMLTMPSSEMYGERQELLQSPTSIHNIRSLIATL